MLLLVVFTAMSDAPTSKPGEASVAAAAAPPAAPRSLASSSGDSASDARLAGAGSDFVRAAVMAQGVGQLQRQFDVVRGEMLTASARTDASIAGTQDSVATCAAHGVTWTSCSSR